MMVNMRLDIFHTAQATEIPTAQAIQTSTAQAIEVPTAQVKEISTAQATEVPTAIQSLPQVQIQIKLGLQSFRN
ncbi:23695_t:CDS:2 [Gigaspora rosea]|nr:23695_t:CDS:2 [Gigaspora rosea]